MLNLDKTVWIYGIWSVAGDKKDWLGQLYRDIDNPNGWEFLYRFRYHKDDKAFDSDDVKNWYKMKRNGTLESVLETIADVLATIEREFGSQAHFTSLECAGDDPKVFFELGAAPWSHVKQVSSAD